MSIGPGSLRHIVLFGLKSGCSDAERAELVRRFERVAREVPGVESFEWGADCSPEGLNNGLTHAFVLTFDNEAARDAYLPHPVHMEFVEWTRQHVERATVVDYFVGR
jgi:hypothetical protein